MNYGFILNGFILLALGLHLCSYHRYKQVQVNGFTVNGFFSRFAPSRMTLLNSLKCYSA